MFRHAVLKLCIAVFVLASPGVVTTHIAQVEAPVVIEAGDSAQQARRANKDKSSKEGKRIFLEARDRIASEDWASAEQLFRQYLRDYPQAENVDAALYWLAFTCKKQAKFAEANNTLRRLLREFPRSAWADDARAMEIEIAAQTGNRRAVAEAARGAQGENAELKIVALQSLFESDPERAVGFAADLLKADSTASVWVKEIALNLLGTNAGGNNRALALLMDAARTNPNARLRRAAIFGLAHTGDERAFIYLRELIATSADGDAATTALHAIAQSGDPRKRELLLQLARSSPSVKLRRDAILILGQGGTDEAITELIRIYDASRDVETRKAVLIALSQSGSERAAARLLQMARAESSVELRREAMLMLGQTGGANAISTLVELYDAESNSEIKEHILTSLAQTNSRQALQKLIDVARRDSSVEMRKRAIFWLGQSGDPEARRVLEEILRGNPR